MISLKQSRSLLSVIPATILILSLISTDVFADDNTTKQDDSDKKRISIYYFHNDYRCSSCIRIEKWSHEIIQQAFAEQLTTGKIKWHLINTDLPENKHFEKDYQLYTKALIISETTGSKETRWKNLVKVWHYLNNKEKFNHYVLTELNAFIK